MRQLAALGRWLDDRTGWSAIRDRLAAGRARADNPAHYIGGLLVFLLFMQGATGILLLLHYQPSAAEAHRSVALIVGGIPYGLLVRNLHVWSSHLLVAGIVLQLFVAVIRRSFSAPNELLWVSGMIGFLILLGLAFTGAVLPWSESAYLQARVGSAIVGQTPWLGPTLRTFMRGGEEVTGATLHHAYGFHVAVLPAALTALVVAHAALLRRRATRDPPSAVDVGRLIPVYPDLVVRLAATMMVALAVLITLATFVEQPLGDAASPEHAAPVGAQPPWYFLFVHHLLSSAPPELLGVPSPKFIVGALGAFLVVFFFFPFLDRRGSRVTAVLATVLLAVAALLSFHALA